jgi:hypothetical protein
VAARRGIIPRACGPVVPTGSTFPRRLPEDAKPRMRWWPSCRHGPGSGPYTLILRGNVHPEAADKRFRRFVMRFNRHLYGRRWLKHGQGIRWARTLECQRRGTLHYHVVFVGVSGLRPHDCARMWNDLVGIATIEPIRDTAASLHYLIKDLHGPVALTL